MSAMQGALSAAERSMRSVFVGNIPYEATEEQLKDIFSEVGPVVSFRLVYDRETGKPKGYGFCEYKDQEMALSAMRNLNGYELNGRALRVDNAASEKSKEELKNLQASLGGPPVESPYGPEVPPEKAPEVIAKVMASLPPEQLYELMTQMKTCIENNPVEARNLLIQNPQLSYALLQAQVMMRIIDPQTAASMLHSTNLQAPPAGLLPTPDMKPIKQERNSPPVSIINEVPASFPTAMPPGPPGQLSTNSMGPMPRPPVAPQSRPSLLGDRPAIGPAAAPANTAMTNQFPEREPRMLADQDLRQVTLDRDMRQPPLLMGDKDMRQPLVDQDFRTLGGLPPVAGPENRPFDPRYRGMVGPDSSRAPILERPHVSPNVDPRGPYEGRPVSNTVRMEDPRGASTVASSTIPGIRMPANPRVTAMNPASPMIGSVSTNAISSPRDVFATTSSSVTHDQQKPVRLTTMNTGSPGPNVGASPRQTSSLASTAAAISPHDQEKAQLIMQVLQLTDQQIAMLPPEQRQSIMILKEQIARSQQTP